MLVCLFLNSRILYLDGGVGGGGGGGKNPKTTKTGGEALPKRILLLTWTTSRNQWKERLEIRKIASLKTNEDIAPQCRQILQTFVWWGPATNLFSPLPTLSIQTSVNFGNFTELYLCTLKTYHFLIWQCYSY